MEIVVNDTNILIDLAKADLLRLCPLMSLEFHTLDVIVEEVEDYEQRRAVDELVAEGTLKVRSLSGKQMMTVMEKVEAYEGKCNLSPEDISVLVYAKENGFRLLTGDKTLRTKAIDDGVRVSGILYLTDRMVEENLVSAEEMISILKRLLTVNKRLPKRSIEERIEELKCSDRILSKNKCQVTKGDGTGNMSL